MKISVLQFRIECSMFPHAKQKLQFTDEDESVRFHVHQAVEMCARQKLGELAPTGIHPCLWVGGEWLRRMLEGEWVGVAIWVGVARCAA